MVSYDKAPEVLKMLTEIINKYHPDLKTAKFYCLFRDEPQMVKGKAVFAQVKKFPAEWIHAVGHHDFLLMVHDWAWNKASLALKQYVLDHEASHCCLKRVIHKDPDTGEIYEAEFGLVGHDHEDFAVVVQRHGLLYEEMQNMAAACKQAPLPFPECAAQNNKFAPMDEYGEEYGVTGEWDVSASYTRPIEAEAIN